MTPMLASVWAEQDPSGWYISEKYNGFRAIWDGANLFSRTGNTFPAPAWFIEKLPKGVALDGELWAGYGVSLASLQSRVRGSDQEQWKGIRFHVFDLPRWAMKASDRVAALSQFESNDVMVIAPQTECFNRAHLMSELWKVFQRGGEGLIIRKPDAGYVHSKHDRDYTKVSLKVYVQDNLRHLPES